jgi:hypothetical protein
VKLRKVGHRGSIDVPAPLIAREYNEQMGAVDDVDHVREGLTTRMRSVKWYHTVWWFLLDTMLGNAYTIWLKVNQQLKMSRQMWYKVLCEELLMEAGVIDSTGNEVPGIGLQFTPTILQWNIEQKTHIPKFYNPHTPEYAKRLNGCMHFIGISDSTTNRCNCAVCYRTMPCKKGEMRVQHFCKQCGVWMHIQCFQEWHLKANPVSPTFATAMALVAGLSRT